MTAGDRRSVGRAEIEMLISQALRTDHRHGTPPALVPVEPVRGSLSEAQAGSRVAVVWENVPQAAVSSTVRIAPKSSSWPTSGNLVVSCASFSVRSLLLVACPSASIYASIMRIDPSRVRPR